jgi:putative colanic acid biosynthesis UDP-glucose lipid carrier transferase
MIRTVYLKRLGVDLLLISLCFFIAKQFFPSGADYISKRTFILYSYIISFWYFASQVTFLYNDFLSRSLSQEVIAVVKTIIVQDIFIIIALFFASRNAEASKWFMVCFVALQFVFLPFTKYLTRWYFGFLFAKNKFINIVIVGAGKLGMDFNKIVESNNLLGYKISGFLDDAPKPYLNGQYLGELSQLSSVLQNDESIQEVIVALPNAAITKIREVVNICDANGKRVKIIPDYYKLSANLSISTFGDLPLISLRKIPLDDSELRFFKAFFDFIFSTIIFLLVFSWLFPILMILIKLSSKGPVFYIQERWGINGKKILCYKFRTMYCKENNEIDEDGKFRATEKNDSRITKIGSFLRKHNLDELPQFLNVLKGEMSIAGPRPHASIQNRELQSIIDNYNLRHLVKPGITGWAQIHGFRGETKELKLMQKRIDFDIWYIENWSLWLDFQIIIQTVINMIKGDKNAY